MNLENLKNRTSAFQQEFLQDVDSRSPNENWKFLKANIDDMLKENVPQKTIRERWDVPYMTPEIERLIRKKKRVYNTMKIHDTSENRAKFKLLRKTVQRVLQRAKNDYLMGLLMEDNKTNTPQVGKKFWQYTKSLKANNSGIGILSVNGKDYSDRKGKAEALSCQYSSVFTDEDLTSLPTMDGTPFPTIENLHIDVEGVNKLLLGINPKTASGPDGIPSRLLKELHEEFAPVITEIFSQSLEKGSLPEDWLTASITAIFKKGNKCDPTNYRPVSLTSVTCKLMEHLLFRHIMTHLENHNILSHFQHGFRSQHSCESQLIITVEDLARNLDYGLQTDTLILDFQKAFDTVPHQRLIQKLDHYGIRGNILEWIKCWLISRTQNVVVEGESSNPAYVKSGVPQGTVLGPLMFLIYINDIADQIHKGTTIRLFADDCLLYRVIQSTDDTAILQADLNSVVNWSNKWQMSFNTKKCKTLPVTTKKNPIAHTYKMADDNLEIVSHHPYLGIELTQNLKWSLHINNIVSKANKALWFLRRNLWRYPVAVKQQMYYALVRPLLEYASSVWDPHTTSDIHKIEMVQRRAARFVIGNYSKTSGTVTNILQQLNWPTLEQRRKESRLINLYKIQHENIAIPLPDYIQRQQASNTRQYHPSKFRVMGPKTNVYKNSYFPRTILEWNSLPQSLYNIHNLDNFKTVLVDSRM